MKADSNTQQLLDRAKSYLQSGDLTDAENTLTEILESDNDNIDAWKLMAILSLENNKQLQATKALKEVLRIEPDSEDAVLNLVNFHGSRKEYDHCETILQNAITANPTYARYYFILGNLYLEMGLHSRAAEHMEQALEASPGNQSVTIALSEIYGRHGDIERSLEVIRHLLEADPPDFQAVMVFVNIAPALNMVADCSLLLDKLSLTQLTPEQKIQLENNAKVLKKNAL